MKLCYTCQKEIPEERGRLKYCSEECFQHKPKKEDRPKNKMSLKQSYMYKCQKLYGLFQSNKW